MPEYFHEINSQEGGVKSEYIVTSDVEHPTTPASDRRESTVRNNGTNGSGSKNKTIEMKEVWFAGCHSDVWVRLRNPSS